MRVEEICETIKITLKDSAKRIRNDNTSGKDVVKNVRRSRVTLKLE